MIPHHNPERGDSTQILVVTCKAQYGITIQQAAVWKTNCCENLNPCIGGMHALVQEN